MRNQLFLSALSLVLWSLLGNAAESTVIFNHVSGARTQLDELVHEHFGKRYSVVDFTDREHTWVYPKGTWKPAPNPPFYVQNRCVSGSVLLLYIISADGSVTDPYVAKSTNPLLVDAAIRRMTERRFQPGRLDGRFVSSVAATNVRFTCQESGINPGAL